MLVIALRGRLPGCCRRALLRAWEEVTSEDAGGSVEFHAVETPEWRAVWTGRRFGSDWRA